MVNVPQVQIPDFAGTLYRGEQMQQSRLQALAARQAMDEAARYDGTLAEIAPALAEGQGPGYDTALARLAGAGRRGFETALPLLQQRQQRREYDQWAGGGATPAGAAPAAQPVAMPAGDMSLPRGIRNNNPLNLSYVAGQPGVQGTDGRFGRYGSMEDGVAASVRQLQMYGQRGLNTIEGIIGRWAPPSENNTPAYVAAVARATGIDPRAPIDMNDAGLMTRLVAAMARHENGRPVDPGVVFSGVQRALGGGQGAPAGGDTVPAQNAAPGGAPSRTGIDLNEMRRIEQGLASPNPLIQRAAQARLQALQFQMRDSAQPALPAPVRLGDGPHGPAGVYQPRPDGTYERLGDMPPPQTQITVQGDTVRGRADAATLTEVQKSANDARQLMALFDRAATAVRAVPEGQGAQLLPIVGQAARALGIEISGTAEAEVLRSVTNGMAVLQRAPGSGATTDFEMRLYMQAVPRLGNTRQGNLMLIDMGRRLAQRRMEEAAIWRRHAGEPDLMDRLNALPPVFGEDEQRMLQDATPVNDESGAIPGPGGRGTAIPPPPPGFRALR